MRDGPCVFFPRFSQVGPANIDRKEDLRQQSHGKSKQNDHFLQEVSLYLEDHFSFGIGPYRTGKPSLFDLLGCINQEPLFMGKMLICVQMCRIHWKQGKPPCQVQNPPINPLESGSHSAYQIRLNPMKTHQNPIKSP